MDAYYCLLSVEATNLRSRINLCYTAKGMIRGAKIIHPKLLHDVESILLDVDVDVVTCFGNVVRTVSRVHPKCRHLEKAKTI